MAIFEGTVRVRLNAETGTVLLDRGTKLSTLTAADAPEILAAALAACKEHKVRLDRWTFFVPELAEKMPSHKLSDGKKNPDPKAHGHDPKAVAAIADRDDTEIKITLGKYSKPRMTIGKPMESTKRKSKYVDIC